MNELLYWAACAAGFWLVIISLMVTTHNIRSSLYFKVIPFLIGGVNLFAVGKLSGVI